MTTLMFAICVVVFLIAETSGGTKNTTTLIRFGAVGRTWVWAGEYWRLGTSMFLHIGALHLFCNAFFGFRMCALAENQIGGLKFLALYLGSGVVGAAASVIGHNALSAGASGALFGVVGWMLVTLRVRAGSLRAFTQNPAIRQQLIWIAAWFVLGAFIGLRQLRARRRAAVRRAVRVGAGRQPGKQRRLAHGHGGVGRRVAGVRVAAPAARAASGPAATVSPPSRHRRAFGRRAFGRRLTPHDCFVV